MDLKSSSRVAVSLPLILPLLFLPMTLEGQQARVDVVPLKNWANPLYWRPNQPERDAAAKAVPALQFSANAVSTDALTFVAITPCRLVDTRGTGVGFNGIPPFSGPSIAGGGTLTIPVQSAAEATTNTAPAPCGVIPTTAQAYSFNVTLVPPGGGSVGYLSIWPAGAPQPVVATLNDTQGLIVANAAIVAAGTPSGGISVYNAGPATADVVIDMNGYFASPSDSSENTAIGSFALMVNTTGSNNTATGFSTLVSNTTGYNNTATGSAALFRNTDGHDNTADGVAALLNNTGSLNTAIGSAALKSNTTGGGNTATGGGALQNNTTGSNNTATGVSALQVNTTGISNTADGAFALQFNTTGIANTANGLGALGRNTAGQNNTATGYDALAFNTTGNGNTANGIFSLNSNTGGLGNTAIGWDSLLNNTTGSSNIAIGVEAARNVLGGNSNNIHIGSQGTAADSGTIRIGGALTTQFGSYAAQTSFFAAGIRGITTGNSDAIPVVVDSNGQLGTISSSQRFKEDIRDMGEASGGLMRLRPVTFRYKQAYGDGSKPLDYGLIAEEVAYVYPGLAVKGADGQVETVQYQKLVPMLLNELQKEHRQIEQQSETIRLLENRLAVLEQTIAVKASPPAPIIQ